MVQKTVLSIGQCRPDNAAINHFLTSNFDVQVLTADRMEDSIKALQSHSIDLILINRKLDADYSDGMEILKTIKADSAKARIPVMLISNFAEWQEKAVDCGAVYGFGKAELRSADVLNRLRGVLGVA